MAREIGPFEATLNKYEGEPVIMRFCNCHPELTFKVAMDTGNMPMMEFASSAKSGMDSADMDGLAALYSMLQDCIEPEDWDAFRSACKSHKVKTPFILEVATSVWAALAERPFESASSSQSGPQSPDTGHSSVHPAIASSATSTAVASKKPVQPRARVKTSGSTS